MIGSRTISVAGNFRPRTGVGEVMKVVITGGTGFLGRPLTAALLRDGHEVVILTRSTRQIAAGARAVTWTPNGEAGSWASEIDGAGAVVNLAGESISKRWTAAQKQRIIDSRRDATRSVVAAIDGATAAPAVLVSGSAVGYYGPLAGEPATEETPPGSDFLARVCRQWEDEAQRASRRTRVVCIRTGVVLERDGGALPQMLPPFWFGAGGPVGSGQQFWPWIHREDWIALVRWTIATTAVSGAVNVTAPHPVTSQAFARALGRAMHRPAFMPAPAFALRLLLGEMADALLLSGQNAVPEKAQRAGFRFRYPQIDGALAALFP
jgi:uncharacterized protein (TIGR01777 family)